MNRLHARLEGARRRSLPSLLLDGGLGSFLIARGLPAGTPPDLWTLEQPETILAAHRAYVEAGSEAIHANTFGSNRLRLARYGLAGRLREINLAAVDLARRAGPRFVLADVGPTGEYLPPVGRGDPGRWREVFEEQGAVLAQSGADGLHIETVMDLREASIALAALRATAPGIPVLASLTFDRKKRGFFTAMGDPLVPSLERLLDEGAEAVGANCSITSLEMADLAREAAAFFGEARLVFQPNAGQPRPSPSGVVYDQSPEAFAEQMAEVASRGVAAVGGCCGTDPHFVAALRSRLGPAPEPLRDPPAA